MPVTVVFGAGGIGTGNFASTWDTPDKVSALLSSLTELGINQLGSAALYPPGNPWDTETPLGQARAVHILYAHAPNPEIPIEETAAAFHNHYLAGRFEKVTGNLNLLLFLQSLMCKGIPARICNFNAKQMREFLSVCSARGYVKPSIYQGQYNALFRSCEKDLFPLLREHNIKFYAYSPLAGGFLTGKLTLPETTSSAASTVAGSSASATDSLSPRNRYTGPNAAPF
ncbi:Aldo/keto reductase [Glonium stellatum]|uniref:Aldo/keto reductase n=1 Tax=Glonium stellatum TaxID=574774 RepID=A0A8E2EZQ7_9PEZI|nr:Aldo/keto reductase [Glonium stellatum]